MKHRLINTSRSLTLRAPALTGRNVCPPPARPAYADSPKEAAPPMPALNGEAALRHLRQTGLYNSLSAAMAVALYKAEGRKGGGYEASNPRQSFRIVFITEGVEVCGSSPAGLGWRLGMRLAAYGYGETKMPVTCAGIKAEGDRVEYELRSGDGAGLSEWYVNRAEGLEQGFTIPQAPGERRAGEKLSLWLSLSGDLKARSAEEGRAILLDGKETEVGLRYDSLHAHDATGRELPARMRLSGGGLKLEVSDEGAVYPVTVDPTLRVRLSVGRLNLEVWDDEAAHPARTDPTLSRQEVGDGAASDLFGRSVKETKLTAGDGGAGDFFGHSVAIDGATAVVGAFRGDTAAGVAAGSAYVFVRTGTVWTLQQKLTASDGERDGEFGWSVAIDEDTVVVGAQHVSAAKGAAYVFTRSGETWTERQKLTASDGGFFSNFGSSVAISGDTVVVGAKSDAANRGAAYVFALIGTIWTQRAKLTASDGATGDYFGHSVAIDGDTVVVGVYAADIGRGSAYVFVRSGTTWTGRQKLTSSDGAARDFGESVAIEGNTLVVGAHSVSAGKGAAYVFTRSGETWTERQKLTTSDGVAGYNFGRSVAVSGDMVVVGASGSTDAGGNAGRGAAYVFARGGETWTEQHKLTASDGAAENYLGCAVAISGYTAVVGAFGADVGANADQGAAYVFVFLTITPIDPVLPEGAVGRPYYLAFTASGGTAPYTFDISGGELPPGLALAQNGILSGTSAFPGMFTFKVQATDAAGVSSRRDYTLVIKPPITVNPTYPVLPEGAVEQPYNLTFTTSGGTAPFTFAVIAGSFPPGLTLAEDGNLSGTPTFPGLFTFRVQATDSVGVSGWRDYTLVIKSPVIVRPTDPILPEGAVGLAYRQLFTASGGAGSYTFARVVGSLPQGLALAADGNLTGTPTAEGESTFTIQATDDNGISSQREYTLVIKRSLIVNPTYPILPEGKVGQAYQQRFNASGGTTPYTFEIIEGSLPLGLTLAANGNLSGTPVSRGTFDFTVRATDFEGGVGERAYALTISQFLPA